LQFTLSYLQRRLIMTAPTLTEGTLPVANCSNSSQIRKSNARGLPTAQNRAQHAANASKHTTNAASLHRGATHGRQLSSTMPGYDPAVRSQVSLLPFCSSVVRCRRWRSAFLVSSLSARPVPLRVPFVLSVTFYDCCHDQRRPPQHVAYASIYDALYLDSVIVSLPLRARRQR